MFERILQVFVSHARTVTLMLVVSICATNWIQFVGRFTFE